MFKLRWLAKPLWVVLFGLRIVPIEVTGRGLLREIGACILGPKHRDGADGAALEWALPFPIQFVVRDDYGSKTLRKLVASVIRVVWISRGGFTKTQYKHLINLLDSGERLVIFQEGTRSPILQRAEESFVILAHRRQVPVVPITINGTDNLLRAGFLTEILKLMLRRRPPIQVVIHKPMTISPNGRTYRELADQVMLTIATATPPHQRGIYGGRVLINSKS